MLGCGWVDGADGVVGVLLLLVVWLGGMGFGVLGSTG